MSLPETLLLFVYSIICLLCFYGLGNFISSLIFKKAKKNGFEIVLGILLLSSTYALFKSSFKTILLFNLVLFVFIFFRNRKNNTISFLNNFSVSLKDIFSVIIVFAAFFLFQYFNHFQMGTGIPFKINEDLTFYGRLSGYLRDFGVENFNIEYFLEDKGGNSPYHYVELWCSAMISDVFKIKSRYALLLITYPLFFTSVFLLLKELFKKIASTDRLVLRVNKNLLIPIVFFICSSTFLWPDFIIKIEIFSNSLLGYPKLSIVACFFLSTMIAFLNKSYEESLLYLSILQINFIAAIPACSIFCSIFILLYFIKKLQFDKELFRSLFLPLATTAMICVFYVLFGGDNSISPQKSDFFTYFFESKNIIKVGGIVVLTIVQMIVTGLPFLIIYFLVRKNLSKKTNTLFLLSFVFLFSAVLSWAILSLMHDSVQLWNNMWIPLFAILGTAVIFISISQMNIKKALIPLFLIIPILVIYEYSLNTPKGTLNEWKSEFFKDSIEGKRFVYLTEKEDYSSYFSKIEQVYLGYALHLEFHSDPYIITCLTNHLIPVDTERDIKFQNSSTFIKYCNLKKKSLSFVSYENCQIEFINEHEIDYLMVRSNRTIPQHLQPYFEEKMTSSIDSFDIYKRLIVSG